MGNGRGPREDVCRMLIYPIDGNDGSFGIAFEIREDAAFADDTGTEVLIEDGMRPGSVLWFNSREERDRFMCDNIPRILDTLGVPKKSNPSSERVETFVCRKRATEERSD